MIRDYQHSTSTYPALDQHLTLTARRDLRTGKGYSLYSKHHTIHMCAEIFFHNIFCIQYVCG